MTRRPATATRFLFGLLIFTCTWGTATTRAADFDAIVRDVRAIAAPGLPGTVCALDANAFVIVDAPTGGGKTPLRQGVIAAATAGKGKIVLFGHDGYFNPATLKEADTGRLLLNLLQWAGAAGKDGPYIDVVDMPQLTDYLKSTGLPAVSVTAGEWSRELVDPHVTLLPPRLPANDADAARIRRALDAGGAVFLAGTGWGWLQTHPGRTLAEHPANRLLAPLGLALGGGTIDKDKRTNAIAVGPVAPLLNAQTALDLLQATSNATPKPPADRKNELAQAADTLMHAARAVPPDAPIMKRLAALAVEQSAAALPSPAKPLRQSDALARVLLAMRVRDAQLAPVDQLKASPAANEFPGEVRAGAARVTQTIPVDLAVPRWHSTGLYAAPGETVTVTIPPDAADKRLRLRIGPHTDHTYQLANWHRAPEISRSFALDRAQTRVANAFGGLIYVEVPQKISGTVDITIANAAPAPLFVLGKTTPAEWRATIRNAPAPWGEIGTDKLILTIPSDVLRTVDDPTEVLKHWDRVMDATATLAAWPLERTSPERIVPDADISVGYMHSGYPIMTGLDVVKTMVDLPKLKTVNAGSGFYHEIGHNHQNPDWTFAGTTEVTVNLFTMHTLETVCGVSPADATRRALVDPAARINKYLAKPDFEAWKADPFMALAMYAQLRLEFGWAPFERVFAEYRALPANQRPRTEEEKHDQWMVRMSNAVGKNLGPFFQAWGIPTSDAARQSIKSLPAWMPAGMTAPAEPTAAH